MKPPKPPMLPRCLCSSFLHWFFGIASPSRMLTESVRPSCEASERYFDKLGKFQIAMLEYKIATRTCSREEWRTYRRYLYFNNLKG